MTLGADFGEALKSHLGIQVLKYASSIEVLEEVFEILVKYLKSVDSNLVLCSSDVGPSQRVLMSIISE